jgi:hypothetical protein
MRKILEHFSHESAKTKILHIFVRNPTIIATFSPVLVLVARGAAE